MSGITYTDLLLSFRKGLRNGNWRHLNSLDKALYRASLWYAKYNDSIVSMSLLDKLSELAKKLKETVGMKIFNRGFEKAVELTERYEKSGVFTWMPRLKNWLKDPDYIFFLGVIGESEIKRKYSSESTWSEYVISI